MMNYDLFLSETPTHLFLDVFFLNILPTYVIAIKYKPRKSFSKLILLYNFVLIIECTRDEKSILLISKQ